VGFSAFSSASQNVGFGALRITARVTPPRAQVPRTSHRCADNLLLSLPLLAQFARFLVIIIIRCTRQLKLFLS